MEAESSHGMPAAPIFGGDNYQVWVIKMKVHLKAQDLWEAIEADYEIADLPVNPTVNQIKIHKERKTRKAKAMAYLYAAVSPNIFTKIMNLPSAKDIWDYLKEEYQGNERAKNMQVLNLIREFEMKRMKESETVKEYTDMLLSLANKVRLLGNLGNLLLIIIPAVCEEKDSPFGDSLTCSTNGETYASLSMAIGAVYIWSYVYNIVRASVVHKTDSRNGVNSHGEASESCKQALLSSMDCPSSEDHESLAELPPIGSDYKVSNLTKIKQQVKIFAEKINLKMLFAPSTVATIVGLLIGVITPIRKVMIGENAPLRALESSASLLGEATIPAMTLIVGANLLRGLKKSGVDPWVVVGVNVVRYVALPLSGIVVVKAAGYFGWVGSDSLYQFVLLLQYALPSAMAMGTITQLFEVGESECSVIMLWNYAVASLFLTLWSTYYMWLVS